MAATTSTHQSTCTQCGQDFTPTIRRALIVSTEPETCPAGGGAGHQARAEAPHPSPRKDVTAWEAEISFDDDPPFVVGTLHHGLGEMTRFDLSSDDARQFAAVLIATADEADQR